MAFTIGRLGVATASGGDGRTMAGPFYWSTNGRDVTVAGLQVCANDADVSWFYESIAALDPAMNPDEPDVPVTCSGVSTLNGYFAVQSASARIPPGSQGTGTLLVEWQVTMRRGRDWRLPKVEQTITAAGVTAGGGAVPATADVSLATPDDGKNLSQTYGTYYLRTGETGGARLGYATGQALSGYFVRRPTWNLAPASYYKSSAAVIDTGKTYGAVIGRRDFATVSDPRVGNGLVRCVADASNPTQFTVSNWNGSAWNSGRAVRFYDNGGPHNFYAQSAVVLRNSPAECVVRYTGQLINGSGPAVVGGATVDVCVARGDRLVRFYCAADYSPSWQMRCVTVTACTTVTGGMRSTSTISSEYQVFLSDNVSAFDTVNGYVGGPAGAKRYFATGWTSGGSTSSAPDGAAPLVLQGFYSYSNALRVVTG